MVKLPSCLLVVSQAIVVCRKTRAWASGAIALLKESVSSEFGPGLSVTGFLNALNEPFLGVISRLRRFLLYGLRTAEGSRRFLIRNIPTRIGGLGTGSILTSGTLHHRRSFSALRLGGQIPLGLFAQADGVGEGITRRIERGGDSVLRQVSRFT